MGLTGEILLDTVSDQLVSRNKNSFSVCLFAREFVLLKLSKSISKNPIKISINNALSTSIGE